MLYRAIFGVAAPSGPSAEYAAPYVGNRYRRLTCERTVRDRSTGKVKAISGNEYVIHPTTSIHVTHARLRNSNFIRSGLGIGSVFRF